VCAQTEEEAVGFCCAAPPAAAFSPDSAAAFCTLHEMMIDASTIAKSYRVLFRVMIVI
jgi:hypothetical protein